MHRCIFKRMNKPARTCAYQWTSPRKSTPTFSLYISSSLSRSPSALYQTTPGVSMRFMFLPYLSCHAYSYTHISRKAGWKGLAFSLAATNCAHHKSEAVARQAISQPHGWTNGLRDVPEGNTNKSNKKMSWAAPALSNLQQSCRSVRVESL